MSTEDVIELGSSDDEKEPPPKKKKTVPNAMVRIPNPYAKLPGLSIKPAKKITSICLPHVNTRSNKTITKIANSHSVILRNPLNRKPIKMTKPIRPLNTTTNIVNKTIVGSRIKNIPETMLLNNLPSSITVTRAQDSLKRNTPRVKPPLIKTIKVVEQAPQVIQTVEIDDEEIPETSATIPQWYKRPEEEVDEKNLSDFNEILEDSKSIEEQNNKEPEPHLIEITIEDSPIKPVKSKQTNEVSNAIVIEDSPVKPTVDKDGNSKQASQRNDKESKKKLDYPHEIEIVNNGMVEIEIKPTVDYSAANTLTNTVETKELKESNSNKQNDETTVSDGEFNTVYQKFIDTCFRVENSDDMKKIVEKKIKAYYKQCSKEYVDSEEFIDLVSGKIVSIDASPDKLYLYIKDVVDELNMQRKLTKAAGLVKEVDFIDNKDIEIDRSEYDSKRQRHIRKLEKTLKKLHRAIHKLEEQEVDFDDEDDSVYILTERYKERLVKVHAKFCQLTNTKMPSEPSIKLEIRSGRPAGPTRKVEKMINVKVPIGALLPFPDFHDVLRCVREANNEDKLGWSEMEIMEEARDIFTSCGKKMQRRRQENEWRIAASRLPSNTDPADTDDSLKTILEKNKQLATEKESEVFKKYADRQLQLKLEGEEIGDKEAEESPVESEEEDDTENSNLLKDREKRKKRLKRLIEEKSKSVSLSTTSVSEKVEVRKNVETITESEQMEVDQSVPEMKNSDNSKEKKEKDGIQRDVTEHKDSDQSESQVISNEENAIESDIEELHLLQKLYSDSEGNSSTVDSESVSAISLSDTDEDNLTTRKLTVDVISIENSSYSESEMNIDDNITEVDHRNNEDFKESTVQQLGNNMEIEILVDDSNKTVAQINNGNNNEKDSEVIESDENNSIESMGKFEVNLSSMESIDSTESHEGFIEYTRATSNNDCYNNDSNDTKDDTVSKSEIRTEDNLLSTKNDEEPNENVLLSSDDEQQRVDSNKKNDRSDNEDNISTYEVNLSTIESVESKIKVNSGKPSPESKKDCHINDPTDNIQSEIMDSNTENYTKQDSVSKSEVPTEDISLSTEENEKNINDEEVNDNILLSSDDERLELDKDGDKK